MMHGARTRKRYALNPRRELTASQIANHTGQRVTWIAENLKIETQEGRIENLAPNPCQLSVWRGMQSQEAMGLPVRLIILKARRGGCSTGIESDFFARTHHLPHRHAIVVAHLAKSSKALFSMSRRFYQYLHKKQRRPTKASSAYEIVYRDPHGSSMTIATAGSKEASRSQGYTYAHLSEYAFWPNQLEGMASITSTIPNLPDTCIVIESTANGVGDDFHTRWIAATERIHNNPNDLDGYIPIFISWLTDRYYSMAVPLGYIWSNVEPDVAEDEPELREMGATDEQLYWRRWKIAGDLGGSVDKFRQEYPHTPDVAFQTSGRPVMPIHVITHHRRLAHHGRKATLHLDPKQASGIRADYDDSLPGPYWRIWLPPNEDGDYAVGGDVATGALSDTTNVSSEPDASCALAIERNTLEDAAEWHGRVEPDLFGLELLKAAMWYNRAWVSPEINSMGQAALLVLKRARYPYILQRLAGVDSLDGRPRMADGWQTTTANRTVLLMDMLRAVRMNCITHSYDGQMIVRSHLFLDELLTFIYDKAGRMDHQTGKHDDSIFARAIAYQIHLSAPRRNMTSSTQPRPPRTNRDLARSNAVDPGPWRMGTNSIDDEESL